MNDQRQVIFGQRLKILKSSDTLDVLDSFLDEILISLVENCIIDLFCFKL